MRAQLVVLTRRFVDNVPLWELDRILAPLGAQYLSPERSPGFKSPHSAFEGEREGAVNPRLAPWAELRRSFGAEFFNELLSWDTIG